MSQFIIKTLLQNTHVNMNLFARNATQRLQIIDTKREHVFNGDFTVKPSLLSAMKDVDLVYLDDMSSFKATRTIVQAMDKTHIKRIVCMNVFDIFHEVSGTFLPGYNKSANIIEDSDLNYTMAILPLLYNQTGNSAYEVTRQGHPLKSKQITRQAVAKFVVDLINNDEPKYYRSVIGLTEPSTYVNN